MVCSLRRGIRSSVDRRSESGIDGDDDDTDRVQPDSPPSFLALVGLAASYRRAGWKGTKLVKRQKSTARESSLKGRVFVGTGCGLVAALRSRGTASRPVLGKGP